METVVRVALLAAVSYLLGAFPSSYIAGRMLRGIDLREHGSGNLGAANTFRVLGSKAAVPVLLADIGKGFLAVRLVPLYGLGGDWFTLLAALIAILGHNYSVFVGFSGGKGVGTATGVFLAMAPLAVSICIVIWIVVLIVSRIVSVASMVAAALLPPAIYLTDRYLDASVHRSVLYLSIVVAVLVLYRHRSNMRRLREGTEKRIF
jgi:acyl phosphate:glycerol-3-phosphate acyltransferase